MPLGSHFFYKGIEKDEDGYDPLEGRSFAGNTAKSILKVSDIQKIIFWGLPTEYCIKTGVLTACKPAPKYGWKVYVAIDACRAVNLNPGDEEKAIEEMKAAGAIITTTEEVINGRA